MSGDSTLIAQEIQDLSSAVGDVAEAVRARGEAPAPVVNVNVPEAPAPVVNVNVPEAPAPVVNVAAPKTPAPVVNINVPEAPAPHVTVLPSVPASYAVRITERDANGLILAFTITPQP